MSLNKNPMHPGEFLVYGYLEPLSISIESLSDRSGINVTKLQDLIDGSIPLNEEMAEALSKTLGRSVKSWMIIQKLYNETLEGESNE